MTTVPTFSFVIPCFNEEDNNRRLGARNRREDYEIIVVNDASTDHTCHGGIATSVMMPICWWNLACSAARGRCYQRGHPHEEYPAGPNPKGNQQLGLSIKVTTTNQWHRVRTDSG